MTEKSNEDQGSILDPKAPAAEQGHIRAFITDRTGDRRYDGIESPLLTIGGAIEVAKEEMAKGKWLRTVNSAGVSHIVQNITELADEETAKLLFEDVSEMSMIAALQGG